MPFKRTKSPSPGRMLKQAKKALPFIADDDYEFNSDSSLVDKEPEVSVLRRGRRWSPQNDVLSPTINPVTPEPAGEAFAEKTDESHKASKTPSFDPTNSVLNSSRMENFLVGSTKVRFLAHQSIFRQTYAGDFFLAARTNGFRNFSNDEIIIPEDDPKTFGIFVRWLYGLSLGLGSAKDSISSVAESQSRINIYIFAKKYRCSYLQDLIMSDMYHCASQGRKVATELRQHSLQQFVTDVPRSHMHSLLARWIAKDILLGDIKNEDTAFESVPSDLLRMVLREMHGCARAQQAEPSLGLPCDYHHHGDDNVCAFR